MATTHNVPEFLNAAESHRQSGNRINTHKQTASDTVDNLKKYNQGDLMDMLGYLRDGWRDQVEKMLKRLDDMAEYMVLCSKHIGDKDTDNTDWIPPIPQF